MAKLRAQQAAFLQQAEADEAEAEEEGEEGGDSQMEEGPSNAQPAVDESVQQAMETSEAGDEGGQFNPLFVVSFALHSMSKALWQSFWSLCIICSLCMAQWQCSELCVCSPLPHR